jgi:dCTP deaminase
VAAEAPRGDGAGGLLPAQRLRDALANGVVAADAPVPEENVQPASLDLRLGGRALALQCSFLPDRETSIESKLEALVLNEFGIGGGAVLERNRPYLIPLQERLRLPPELHARANPKSSTGRLDVFTRVITDRNHRFDEIVAGYEGRMYLEVVPRSFAIRVETGLALNQLRLMVGDSRLNDAELRTVHAEFPLLYHDSHPLRESELAMSDGLFLSLDVAGAAETVVGFRAKRNSLPIDLSKVGEYAWRDYWDPVYPEAGRRIVLEPEAFYLLLSAEGVCIPPGYAAEMMAYDPTAGELRTHYAGFFDPGFGFDPKGRRHGSRAALEVRARDVSFMVEHRQPVCKLGFERMHSDPDVLYGAALHSNYQGQETTLSKHFAEQRAARDAAALEAEQERAEETLPMFDG